MYKFYVIRDSVEAGAAGLESHMNGSLMVTFRLKHDIVDTNTHCFWAQI